MKFKSLLIVLLVVSLAINIAQFVTFKQNDKVATNNAESQIEQQKITNLEEVVKQRETRIKELQTLVDGEKTEAGDTEKIEDEYSKSSIKFAKLALGGRVSTEDYDDVLKENATSELSERMKKTVDGEYSGQSSIKVIFSHEQSFVDLNTVNNKEVKVFVKLNYKYDTTNTETKVDSPESTAYLLLTLVTEEGSWKVSNYEMG